MKKILLACIALVYAMSVLGIGADFFFCCQRLRSVTLSLAAMPSEKHGPCKKKSCCKTKSFQFKVSKDQKTFDKNKLPAPKWLTTVKTFGELWPNIQPSNIRFAQQQSERCYTKTNPPPLLPKRLREFYCVFRI